MALTKLEIKQKSWKKKKENSPTIECACGCGGTLKSVDDYGRPKAFLNGHNRTRYQGVEKSKNATNKRWRDKNPDLLKRYKTEHYRRKKLRLIEMFGNKCHHCSLEYNGRNAPVFEFHHTDPSLKEGTISKMIMNRPFDAVMNEIEKCIMICSNCHILHHNGRW